MRRPAKPFRAAWANWTLWALPVWPCLVVLLALQRYASGVVAQSGETFVDSLVWFSFQWAPWALLSPLLFYLMFRPSIDSMTGRHHVVWVLAAGVLLIVLHTAIQAMIKAVVYVDVGSFKDAFVYLLLAKAHVEFSVYLVMAALIYCYRFWSNARQAVARQQALEAITHRRRLQEMRQQLAPHFLFNALNSLCSLLREDSREHQMAVAIGHFLRGAIDGRLPTMVTVEQEIEWLRSYLVIEQLRFADRLHVRWAVDPATLQLLVPPMLLQPLVENAMTHGVAQTAEPTLVEVCAECLGGDLQIVVRNSSEGRFEPSAPGTGQGLRLIREVLDVAYSGAAELACRELPDGYEAQVTVPARSSND